MFGRAHSVKDHPKEVAGIAAGGVLIGAASAMLLTPRRGSEVRSGLKRRGRLARHTMQRMAAREKEVMKDAAGRAQSTAVKVKQDAVETARDAKTAAKDAKADAKDMVDHIRQHGEP